jgi:Tfp pilus assembly protein PilF
VEGVPPAVWVLVEAAAATTEEDQAKRLFLEAEDEARRAVAAEPDQVGTHFALAVVLGLRADVEGGRTKVRAAAALHDELTLLLEMDPEHARARHMLGRLHAGVMRMNGVVRWVATRLLGGDALDDASWAEAERHLAFAEERDPAMLGHHLQLANLYRDTDRPELALVELAHIFEREPTSAMEQATWDEAVALQGALGGS